MKKYQNYLKDLLSSAISSSGDNNLAILKGIIQNILEMYSQGYDKNITNNDDYFKHHLLKILNLIVI